MRIYKISSDHAYWSLMASDPDFWGTAYDTHKKVFALEPMRDAWKAPVLYIRDPARTKRGSFHGFGNGRLAYSEEVYDSNLGEMIERSGEILSAEFDGTAEACHIFNCTACYNCLDRKNTQARWTPDEDCGHRCPKIRLLC